MKGILFLLTFLSISCQLKGQTVKFSYQAVFRDSSGELLTERLLGIRLSILNEKSELQYAERHQIKTNNLGLGTLILGEGLEKTGILESIQWGKGALDLKTEVDVLGGKNYGIQSMAPILSVPYAVYTGIADSLRGGRLLPKDAKKGEILYWDGQTWQKLSAGKPGQWLGVSPDGNLQWQFPVPSPGIKDMEILKDNSKIHNPISTDTLKLGRGKPDIGLNKDIQNKDSLLTGKDVMQQFEADKMYQTLSNESNGSEPANNPEITDRLEKKLLLSLPVLTTYVPSSITTSAARGGGVISSDGGTPVTARGVIWSTTPKPDVTLTTKTLDKTGSGAFYSVLSFLSSNTKYYLVAYATNSVGTAYGKELEFTTLEVKRQTKPSVSTAIPAENSLMIPRFGGRVSADGGSAVTARGVIWTAKRWVAIFGGYGRETKTVDGAGLGDFTSVQTRWLENTKYYVRAYASNAKGTEYGAMESFTYGASIAGLPVLTTASVTSVTSNAAQGGGSISSDGGKAITARGIIWSNSPKPLVTLTTKTNDGPGTGTFTSKMSGLAVNTKYYVVAYATNANGTVYGLETNFTTLLSEPVPAGPCPEVASVQDVDGNSYNTIQIGKQCWLKENLRVTKYGDGSLIPLDESGGTIGNATGQTWGSRTNGARTVYNNNLANVGVYGYLYNWYAVTDSKGLCPRGWRVPTDAEWTTLTDYLGGELVAGSKMKSTGTTQWQSTNNLVKNESGFTALPGGYRNNDGRFYSIRTDAFFWTSTAFSENNAWYRYITDIKGQVYKNNRFVKSVGASVRCIKEVSTSSIPILTTALVQTVTSTTAVVGGNVTSQGVSAVTARGVVWSTSPNPTVALATKTVNETGTGAFISNLTGLTPNTTYYIKAYATNSAGTGYGAETSFKTTSLTINLIPSITTSAMSAITPTTANGGGNVTSDGGAAIIARGVVWSTNPNPTITLATKTNNGTGIGAFTSSLTGLTPNTTYYIKSYATNNVGTGYGSELLFKTTGQSISMPSVLTGVVSAITTTTISSGGSVSNDGGSAVTERGVIWSTSPNPTIALTTKSSDGVGTGAFTSSLTGLTPNTTYYIRAYATNSVGTGYGSELSFKTNDTQANSIPAVTTSAISSVTQITSNGGGNVTAQGSTSVTARGVVWSTSPNPTIALTTKTSDGVGTGAFTSSLTGLIPNTIYYVKAYATNATGTGYGNELTFTTLPKLTTTEATEKTESTAKSGGNITSTGNATITARGVVWSTGPNPTIALATKTSDGAGTGAFTSSLTGLIPNTIYYVKAYATNATGTGYGNELTFTTFPKLTTTEVTEKTENSAKSGGNITPAGNATITTRGVVWSTSPNPTIALTTKTSDGVGTGAFTSSLTGLIPNTIYYVKVYATNATGTGYGNELTFNTLPKLTTTEVTEKTENSAKSGGNITPAGNAEITARGVVWSTGPNPTIALATKTSDDKGPGVFTSSVTGLTAKTRYYLRAYATNGTGTNYGNVISFIAEKDPSSCIGSPTVTDINSNVYPTVQIGTQCWMQSNLKVSKYRNGDTIPTGLSDGEWSRTTSGAYAIYNINNANDAIYGSLYNWHSVADNRGLCPTGWHVPTDNEWTILTTYLGGEKNAGGKMKSVGTAYWADPNIGATNESGFSAHGGSWVYNAGYFYPVSLYGRLFANFWSATELDGLIAWPRLLSYTSESLDRLSHPKSFGYSVRCLRDTASAVPTLTTSAISSITSTAASGGGNITTDGGAPVTMRGVVWSTSPIPTISLSTKTSNGGGTGSFTSSLTSLAPNTTYYVRAYATNSAGTGYGNELNFVAKKDSGCIGTQTVKDIDGNIYNTVQIGSQCWTKENLRVTKYREGSFIPLDASGGTEGNGTGNTWNRTTGGARTVYGHNQSNLTTYGFLYNWYAVKDNRGLCPLGWHVPSDEEWATLFYYLGDNYIAVRKMKSTGTTLWESPNSGATNESGFSGLPGGNRSVNNYDDAEFKYLGSVGVWWSSSEAIKSYTAWYLFLNSDGGGDVDRRDYLLESGLSVRCLRDTAVAVPTLTTSAISSITSTTATGGGNITTDGGAPVTMRGVVWSTSPIPTISLSTKTSNGGGTGSFASSLTSLAPNTTYYARAYATNSVGTAYGNELSFKTTAVAAVPTLTTSAISSITSTTATSGGNITTDGGAPVTMRGVVWSTSPTPTISLSTKTSNGVGTGSFTSSLTGLAPNTTYYVRAYATNSAGTGYGNELSFKTTAASAVPTLTTSAISSITSTTASSGGNITTDGGAPVTMRGVVWSTSPTPTISLSTKTSNGVGTGSFASSLTGLAPNTTYYVRAYATNSVGTAYGNELSFIAEKDPSSCVGSPTVTDINSNVYATVKIGTQCWMQSNLKVSKYRNGDAIPTGLSDGEWRRTTSGAYAIYENNNANDAIYGKLYNWYAVKDVRGLCPTGWRVPSDAEWTILTTYLGGDGAAGGKMKSIGTTYWVSPNTGATNESGFTALPGGARNGDGSFYYIRSGAFFWSATEGASLSAWNLYLNPNNGYVTRSNGSSKSGGDSVRCLRD